MKHNIMHVEVYLGPGEQTIAARWNSGVVQLFPSYKFESKSYRITDVIFKTIDPWLDGQCKSYCIYHTWDEERQPINYNLKSSSVSRFKISVHELNSDMIKNTELKDKFKCQVIENESTTDLKLVEKYLVPNTEGKS